MDGVGNKAQHQKSQNSVYMGFKDNKSLFGKVHG